MVFVDGVEGESTITHHSNSWPEIRVMDPEDSITDYLLMVGRCGPPHLLSMRPARLLSTRRCISQMTVRPPPPPPSHRVSPAPSPRRSPLAARDGRRLVTFNTIKTKKGWVWAGGFAALFGVMQTYYIGSAIMQKRRRIKALEDVKKM